MNHYPIRGWLNMLAEGNCTVEEVEEVINRTLKRATEQAYAEAISDVRLYALGGSQRREQTPDRVNIPKQKNEGSERRIARELNKLVNLSQPSCRAEREARTAVLKDIVLCCHDELMVTREGM